MILKLRNDIHASKSLFQQYIESLISICTFMILKLRNDIHASKLIYQYKVEKYYIICNSRKL